LEQAIGNREPVELKDTRNVLPFNAAKDLPFELIAVVGVLDILSRHPFFIKCNAAHR
jgi:hypothetical protein